MRYNWYHPQGNHLAQNGLSLGYQAETGRQATDRRECKVFHMESSCIQLQAASNPSPSNMQAKVKLTNRSMDQWTR